jgi:hypothetical protein
LYSVPGDGLRTRSAWAGAGGRAIDRMRAQFSDEEILEISICVGTWLSLGRIA